MKLKEITLEEIKRGKNWRIVNPSEFNTLELEDLTVEECKVFSPSDYVAYSSLFVSDEGKITPVLTIKEVGSPEYGGDMCEMIEGNWQKVGITPDPNSFIFGRDYVADPLSNDPSYDTGDENDDERSYNRSEFKRWISQL